jgi:hypothetical protein
MWVIVSTTNEFELFNFKNKEFCKYEDLYYSTNEYGCRSDEIENHNFVVSKLLSLGFPIYINKKDARVKATTVNLTGFKYLQLNPSVLEI